MKKFGAVFSFFAVFASGASAQSPNANAYINENLGPFFPEMHHQMALGRLSRPELCPVIAGTLAITPKAVRLLIFQNRRPGDEVSVSAATDMAFRKIRLSSGSCGAQFQIFRMERSSEDVHNILPSSDSGIPGTHSIQVNDNKSIVEVAAFFPESSSGCTPLSIPFVIDGVGLRFMTSGLVPAKTDFSSFMQTPGKRLTIQTGICKNELFLTLIKRTGDQWVDDTSGQ